MDNLINEIETQKRLKKSLENKDTKDLIQIVENYKDQVTTLQQKKRALEQILAIAAGDFIKLQTGVRINEIEILNPQDSRIPDPPTVISPNSNLAGCLLGYSFEDEIKMPNGAPAVLLEIRKPSGLILTIESDRNSEKSRMKSNV